MTYPNKKETMALLEAWQTKYEEARKTWDSGSLAIGLDINGPLFQTLFGLIDAYTDTLERSLGADDLLGWYANDNDMGRSAGHAGYDGKTKPIKSLDDLYKLIVECRKRVTVSRPTAKAEI